MDSRQHYVLGFMFSDNSEQVLLIRKARPQWQAGRWNGVGGKVESGESAVTAMVREFSEETGLVTDPATWQHFAQLQGPAFDVWCFRAKSQALQDAQSCTDEEVVSVTTDLNELTRNGVDNVATLVACAMDAEAPFLWLLYGNHAQSVRQEHNAFKVLP